MAKLSEYSPSETGYVRDQDFYHESGDCVVLVGENLFKVHRYRLACDGSAFGEMFSLPNGETCPNSTTIDDPLILQDSVDEFRALCWALYALPLEIRAQNRIDAFIHKFKHVLNLLSISHKYHFESLETWAKELIFYHCTTNADGKNPVLDSPRIRDRDLELMLRVSTRINCYTFSGAAENALMNRLKGRFDRDFFIRNLALAEELGIRKFQGRLYYNELLRQESLQTGIQLSTTSIYSDLTEKQLFALFRGYWSLTCYWKNLPSLVRNKPLPSIAACAAHGRCQTLWNDKWSADNLRLIVDPSPPLPLEKLEKIRPLLISPRDVSLGFGVKIQPCGLRELDEITKQLQGTLADHFLGPGR